MAAVVVAGAKPDLSPTHGRWAAATATRTSTTARTRQSPAEDRHHVDRRDDLDGRPDALADGKTTAIISTAAWSRTGRGWLPASTTTCFAPTAPQSHGNSACAVCSRHELVPEGSIDPPSGHMRSPGTLSLRQETFEAMLTDAAESLKAHGFKNIIFIGDSGGNQGGQSNVAEALTSKWGATANAIHIGEYYRAPQALPMCSVILVLPERVCPATACTTALASRST